MKNSYPCLIPEGDDSSIVEVFGAKARLAVQDSRVEQPYIGMSAFAV